AGVTRLDGPSGREVHSTADVSGDQGIGDLAQLVVHEANAPRRRLIEELTKQELALRIEGGDLLEPRDLGQQIDLALAADDAGRKSKLRGPGGEALDMVDDELAQRAWQRQPLISGGAVGSACELPAARLAAANKALGHGRVQVFGDEERITVRRPGE